ncbi:hypothetical protein ACQVP2_35590, partial [Methylobacterium aquaticum]|uniref:hypothetical protein n=1 Tax=Methylobacterium aquaticum TaxID=270351 RepID=UPI003D1672A2
KGSADLEAQAAKANMTLSASLQVLNNALGKYIGESDEALSASAKVGGAIISIANNLDTIVPVLSTIAIAFGTVKGAGLAFGAVSTAVAAVTGADRALAQQVLLGNASSAAPNSRPRLPEPLRRPMRRRWLASRTRSWPARPSRCCSASKSQRSGPWCSSVVLPLMRRRWR